MNFDLLFEKQRIYKEHLHLIPKEVLEKVQAAFHIEFTHNSTAIEGNTLTLIETKVVLEDHISIGGKKLREIYEVVNNHKATLYVEQCVAEGLPLDEKITKDIHAIINENILVGGIYRNEVVTISGANFKPPVGQKMYLGVKNFFADLSCRGDLNPIELAAWTHAEFVRIHPFIDGNGRTSRQIMNYQLMIEGFPPVSISAKNTLAYYEALDKYGSEKDLQPFVEFVAELVEQRLDEFLEILSFSMGNQPVEQQE
ncbi:MAG: Fic family protein [Bacillota bacterium]